MVHRYSCTSREVDAAVKDTFLEAAQARLVAEGADLPEGALTALEPLRASRPALVGPHAPQSTPKFGTVDGGTRSMRSTSWRRDAEAVCQGDQSPTRVVA